MDPKQIDVGDRRAAAKAGTTLKQACVAVVVFYIAAAILNGRAIHEQASRREYGPVRTVWVTATVPLRWVATTLRIDTFRSSFETILEDEP